MGGQACVFYGAAEFSRDTDIAVLADKDNLDRILSAMKDLSAEVIAIPKFSVGFLKRGHAVHFRCNHPDALGMRVDIMSVMRNVDPFENLWERRTSIKTDEGSYDLISLPDLVQAKKTQRDKDWPMIRRLVEANYFENKNHAGKEHVRFWLKELRTGELLIEIADKYKKQIPFVLKDRPLLEFAASNSLKNLQKALIEEELLEREKDREYWSPLKEELEKMRRSL
jgi:Arc/MetJ-type ribon-helix-helix transcriptional regulator